MAESADQSVMAGGGTPLSQHNSSGGDIAEPTSQTVGCAQKKVSAEPDDFQSMYGQL